jgi:hypothetical protein
MSWWSKEKTVAEKIFDEMREYYTAWEEWLSEAQEDAEFAAGEQWDGAAKSVLIKQKRPILALNMILKHFAVLTGYEKQNRPGIKAYPVEGEDQAVSDIYTQLIAWVLDDSGGKFAVSEAFENAALTGLGWLHPYISYEDDVIDGDIKISSESPFRILPDPQFTKADLSDCRAIFRHAWLTKEECKNLFPEHAKEIEEMTGGDIEYLQKMRPQYADKNRLNVIEKWYKESINRTFIVNTATGEMNEYEGDSETLKAIKESIELSKEPEFEQAEDYADLQIIKKRVTRIKLITVIENSLIVEDGGHPHGLNKFPFVPVFGYNFPVINKPRLKHFGIVRPLKDSQREKNKRRSQIMDAILKMPFSGWLYESGSVADPSALTQSGAGSNIEYLPGKQPPQRVEPPQVPASLIQLEQMHSNDMREIGMNPDLLGMMQSANEPGITTQLRQKQGIVAVQNIFDLLSETRKVLGRYLIDMIDSCFSDEKVMRITGLQELPPSWETKTRYDCIVEESSASPTYRMANFMVLTEMLKSQMLPMSPELMLAWVDASELPSDVKDVIKNSIQQQQQQQQQAEQQAQAQQMQEAQMQQMQGQQAEQQAQQQAQQPMIRRAQVE